MIFLRTLKHIMEKKYEIVKDLLEKYKGYSIIRKPLYKQYLRKPPILMLDEGTSAFDEKNEKEIVKNINQYIEDNKSILIVTSHRDSFKQICNKVLVLNK